MFHGVALGFLCCPWLKKTGVLPSAFAMAKREKTHAIAKASTVIAKTILLLSRNNTHCYR